VRQIISVDISNYSFEEFVEFVFDRDVPPEAEMPTAEERAHRWYYCTNAVFDLHRLSSHYVRLYSESARLLGMFSRSQLEHGFSAIVSGCSFSVKKLIWNTDLPFEHRERVVKSMFYLFRDFFSVEPLRYQANMWWEGLCYVWETGQRQRSKGGEDLAMQDVMFETMSAILPIDSDECRYAALHGLSHLHHPATLELLQRYTSIVSGLERWCEEYAAEQGAWAEQINSRRSR
jgi:hypothetical protein